MAKEPKAKYRYSIRTFSGRRFIVTSPFEPAMLLHIAKSEGLTLPKHCAWLAPKHIARIEWVALP